MERVVRDIYQKFFRIQDCAKHFFRHVDKKKLIDPRHNSINKAFARLDDFSFSFYTSRLVGDVIPRIGEIVAGIYFPGKKIGDVFTLQIGGYTSNIVVTDPNKIYLPLGDEYILPQVHHPLNITLKKSTGEYSKNIYIIYIFLPFVFSECVKNLDFVFKIRGLYYNRSCSCYNCHPCREAEKDHYVRKIQRAWRSYRLRKMKKIVCASIRSTPGLGVDYFEAKERFEKKDY